MPYAGVIVGLYAIIGLICFSGGLLSGATGFGALIVMIPLLLLFLDMPTAIPLGVLCSVGMQFQGVLIFHAHIQTRRLIPLVVGSLPGVWLGGMFLRGLPDLWLKTGLGVLFLCYSFWSLAGRRSAPARPPAAAWGYAVGFCSGALGGTFGIIGPPAIIYATRTGWTPEAIRGTLNALFTILFVCIAFAHLMQGLLVAEVWRLAAFCVPVCFLGNRIGMRLSSRLNPERYLRILFLLITAMGVSLCLPGLRVLIGL